MVNRQAVVSEIYKFIIKLYSERKPFHKILKSVGTQIQNITKRSKISF